MKVAKWLIALVAVMMFVGCAKSDEQKAKDAAEAAQKDAQKALDGVKVPSLK
jgi:Tfp pilus assembly protein PilF